MELEPLLRPGLLVPAAGGLFVLLGVAVALVRARTAKRTRADCVRWARGAYALWTGGEDCGAWSRERAVQSLSSWYGATGPAPFWDVVRGLRHGQTGNAAWDEVRAIDLLRIATAAGYVDDEQCWSESAAIGAELQSHYRSWEELAQAFERGMQAWQRSRGVTDPAELGRVQRNLPRLRAEVWPTVPFDAHLALDD